MIRVPPLLKGSFILGSFALLGVGCPQQPVSQPPLKPAPDTVSTERPVASPKLPEAAVPTASVTATASTADAGSGVSITASGFSPATVTVRSGTTVVFQNADTEPHWVASAPHPVHTGLLGFDAASPMAPGAFYAFTFTAPGTFGYHDHLNPATSGRVIVQ